MCTSSTEQIRRFGEASCFGPAHCLLPSIFNVLRNGMYRSLLLWLSWLLSLLLPPNYVVVARLASLGCTISRLFPSPCVVSVCISLVPCRMLLSVHVTFFSFPSSRSRLSITLRSFVSPGDEKSPETLLSSGDLLRARGSVRKPITGFSCINPFQFIQTAVGP